MGDRWISPDRFRPDELEPGASAGEQAEALAVARELEWLAATDDVAPGPGFADRVMVAIAAEPTPRPIAAATAAVRSGRIVGVWAAFVDLWRVAWTGGRPLAVRLPAMALVVVIAAGVLGAGALGAGALAGLVDRSQSSPSPVVTPSPVLPSTTPAPSPSPSASPSAVPSASPAESGSPEPTESPEATETAEPAESPEAAAPATPRATRTPRPTETPEPTKTPKPGETPEPTRTPDSNDD